MRILDAYNNQECDGICRKEHLREKVRLLVLHPILKQSEGKTAS